MEDYSPRASLRPAVLVLPVLALAFYVGFIAHLYYLYPLHVDEWVHLATSEAILSAGSVTYTPPFFGGGTVPLGANLEIGFQLFWAVVHQVTGIAWMDIFRFFPAVILVLTALSAYVVANRHDFGWEAAFFTTLIPTTIGILGPGFLVPVALGLFFLPLSVFVAMHLRGLGSWVALFLFTSFLLSLHAPSAVVLVLVLVPYILLNIKAEFKHTLATGLALIVPFLAPFPWIFRMLLPTATSLLKPVALSDFIAFPQLISVYGYLPVAFCVAGTFVLAVRGGRQRYGLVLGLVALLAMLVTFYSFHRGVSIVYERGLMFLMLMVGIIAGAGLMWLREMRLAALPAPAWLSEYAGKVLFLGAIAAIMLTTLPGRVQTPYYKMIDDRDYKAFTWIRDNLEPEWGKAVLDPWKATAFAAITGRAVYTRIHVSPEPTDVAARAFLDSGATDTALLKDNGISIVYSLKEVRNPDLVRIKENIYLLKGPS